jgi:molybdopterin-guanine dinucleotide biosynthesis protein A
VKRYRQVAGFILAGGASSRMGRDKGLLDFGGIPLIVHTAQLLQPLVAEVTVVGFPTRYTKFGLSAIADEAQALHGAETPGCGPLAGIATALSATHLPWNLIVACDLPYLSAKWVDWLLSRALCSCAEAAVPRTERGIEPLAAVYRRECGARIANALAHGMRKVSDVIEKLGVEFLYPSEWRHCDSGGLVLRNMNAPEDYEEARKWWATVQSSETPHVRKPRRAPKRKRRSAPRQNK